ncbi:MAG: dethiobiotin synthase [Bacteroidetes bacterium]|jgi:dethiobiotin synthetase|nr:dethiobiotin synthase [Bacteroidota bacterium]MDF2450791.1 dethiobiotin synthase [Bacteroidota bacterium]
MNYFITGIGTNVGKTIVSAVLAEALHADYWKPIQSGIHEGRDSALVGSLISNSKTVIHPEAYLLKEPLSPHFAAKLDGITIEMDKIQIPITNNHLIIEGAGGILVPINQSQYVIDIAKKLDCELILVISNYLGCINHSLLSIDYLMKNSYRIKALVFNGDFDAEIKQAIIAYAPQIKTIDIPTFNAMSKQQIREVSSQIKAQLQ